MKNITFRLNRLRCIMVFLINAIPLFSQESGYLIHNHDFQKLLAAPKACSAVVEDTLGLILCTSGNNLLYFDGKEWVIRKFAEGEFISLFRDSAGSIWYGSIHDFGRIKRSADFGFELESCSVSLPDSLKLFGSVKSIVEYDSSYFFHTSYYIFSLKNGEVSVISNRSRLPRGFLINGDYYTNHDQKGLLRYSSGNFTSVAGGEAFKDKTIVGITALSPDSLIIGTRTDGVFMLNPSSGKSSLWPPGKSELRQTIEKTRLYHLISLSGDNFAFSTSDMGTIITTREGKILRKLNSTSGTNSNRHTYAYLTRSDRLCMCTDYGLSTYYLNSPFYIWGASEGIQGSALAISSYEGRILVGTFRGLYVLTNPLDSEGKVERLLNIPCWSISDATLDNAEEVKLICTQDGLYIYRNHDLQLLFPGNVFKAIQLNKNRDFYLSVGLSGLHAFSMIGGNISHHRMSEYSFTNIRSLVQDKDYIWITYGSTGKNFRISQQEVIDRILDNELDELEFMEISTDHPLEAFNIDSDNYVFSSVDGFLEFDPASNSFIRLRSWGKDVENYAEKATNLSKDLKGNIWLGGSNILLNNYDGTYNLSKMNLEVLSGRTSSSDIYHDDNGRTWIVDERGVILIDGFDLGERGIHNIIFTKFVFPDSSIHYIYKTKTSEDSHDNFSFKHFRELSVHYTLPYQYSTRQVDFSYRMDDYNDQWSNWSTENYTLLSNLKAGKYTFRVKARFENGMETEPSSIGFTIEKFWYETLLFKALVIALTLLILIRIIRMMLKRRNRRELQMEEVITQRVNESFMFKLADRIGSENTGAGNPLDMLTQSGGSLTQPKELFIEKFVSLVEENMSDNELSVEKLAGMLNISQKMLYRRVKNATGLSAKALVRKIRLRNAAILLSKYDLTVAEVAYKVGYNDPSYFTKSFGTEFKKTPLQFQREAKSTAAGDK